MVPLIQLSRLAAHLTASDEHRDLRKALEPFLPGGLVLNVMVIELGP